MILDTRIRTKGAKLRPLSHNESDNNYHSVICANNEWRIIASRCNLQWIIQRRVKTVDESRWDGKAYCTTRKALIRAYNAKTGCYPNAIALEQLLPDIFGGAANG